MRISFMKYILSSLIFVISLSAETHNAILISLDGAQRAHLNELLASGKVPVIKELKAEGAFVDLQIEGHDTGTGPGHAEMLTGLPKELNNVQSNRKYKAIPAGYTIGERLEKVLGKENIVTVMVMGKESYMGASTADQPYYNAKNSIDVWDGDESKRSESVVVKGLDYLDKYKDKRFFMFFHFKDVDSKGHKYGENSPEYEAALISEDSRIGRVLNKLKELKIYDKTMVYVTADHGFDEGKKDHSYAPEIFLVTNDKAVKKNGTQADVVPTILTQFNIDLSKLEPPLPGKPLNR
ncbi:MAG: alkaline phosphatase [Candidatus Firestonebacteria bacterium]|nr:alkaline phosphatase [Candidatus Firestonebacteria bacterium]